MTPLCKVARKDEVGLVRQGYSLWDERVIPVGGLAPETQVIHRDNQEGSRPNSRLSPPPAASSAAKDPAIAA